MVEALKAVANYSDERREAVRLADSHAYLEAKENLLTVRAFTLLDEIREDLERIDKSALTVWQSFVLNSAKEIVEEYRNS